MREHRVAELTGANRLLLGVSLIALALLGPSFILGYVTGYRSGRAAGPQSASPQIALPAETEPQQPPRMEQPKPAGWERTEKPTSASRTDHPAAGQVYLQLVATDTSRSAAIVDALRNDGFPAVALEVPQRPGIRRVLVGPFHEGELDKTRAELRSKGFPGDAAIKRTLD
jgi:cell division septation protein DedD